MKKNFLIAFALLFAVGAQAQSLQHDLYMIDAAGNIVRIAAPAGLTGNQTFTFPTTGGTVLTTTPPSAGVPAITVFGTAGTGLAGTGSQGILKMYNGTDISPLIFQTTGTGTYTFPSPSLGIFASDATGTLSLIKGTANQALVMNALGTGFTWATIAGASSTPTYDAATLGNSTTPTQGGLTLYDGGTGLAGNTLLIQAISTLGGNYTYTLPDAGANANFLMSTSTGGQTIAGGLTVNGGLTLGTALTSANGGTGLSTFTKGSVLYASAADTWGALAGTTTDGWVLTWNNTTGLPEWRVATAGSTFASSISIGTASTTTGTIVVKNAGNANSQTVSGTSGASAATFSLPNVASADFVMTEGNQTLNGNKTLSGTTNLSGLTASLPLKLDGLKNITSAAIALGGSEVTGTLTATKGGTGLATYVKGDLLYSSAANTLSALAGATVDGKVLSWNNTTGIPEWRTSAAYDNTNVNITGGTVDPATLKVHNNNGWHLGWDNSAITKDVNHVIDDNSWSYNFDPTGTNKKAKFSMSSITSGTTRTYTLPDASGTLAIQSGGTSTAPQFGSVTATTDVTNSGGAATGTVYAANQCIGWAEITSAGVITNSFGNVSITHIANSGIYAITLPNSISNGFAVVTLTGAAGGICTVTRASNVFTVRTLNLTGGGGSLTDYPFNMMIMAR